MPHLAAAVVAAAAVISRTTRVHHTRATSHASAHQSLEEEFAITIRVRTYAFGDHIRANARGVLTRIPNSSDTDMCIVKGLLLREAYVLNVVQLSLVDWTTVHVLLLPGGEEILNAGAYCRACFAVGSTCRPCLTVVLWRFTHRATWDAVPDARRDSLTTHIFTYVASRFQP